MFSSWQSSAIAVAASCSSSKGERAASSAAGPWFDRMRISPISDRAVAAFESGPRLFKTHFHVAR